MLIPYDHGKHQRGFTYVDPYDHAVSWTDVGDHGNGRVTSGDGHGHTVHEYHPSESLHQWAHPGAHS